ncbi:hemerythrin domain-containing protein [Endozoicomonas euniceicola]|uniref:Hemerythrin domain-containing protein n=1 Tax=Endozoicomonas euniceicola TaxID=1234143 RepID=A0ABY6GWM6_9GAMM|nr:hemerythrin domain-containing protein [Endozoicomonas euniceicola]UYM17168.1 hemerythrin domain-containing protein [Endozoicomonas euniceicola]
MSILIDRIIKDHEHLTRLLVCLDREISKYKEGATRQPRLSVIIDALDYLHNYPDSFHHPLESRLLAKLRPRITDAGLRQKLEAIEEQHVEIYQLTNNLIDRFQSIQNDQIVPVDKLLADYQRYAELQINHIKMENIFMIPAMKKLLTEEDVAAVKSALNGNPDPLFGAHLWDAYEDLYQFVVGTEQEQVAV